MLRVLVSVILFMRFGILAASARNLAIELVHAAPLSLDASAWYFSASVTYIAAMLALAGCAAWVSLGKQGDSKLRMGREVAPG